MSRENVTIQEIEHVPNSIELLEDDTSTYVALGCVACPNRVCLKVDGIDVGLPSSSPAAASFDEAIQDLDKLTILDNDSVRGWDEACSDGCFEESFIRDAAISINRRFGKIIDTKPKVK